MTDLQFMDLAFEEAELAFLSSEVPVGAVVVINNKVISKAHNNREETKLVIGHAETLAIIEAETKMQSQKLNGASIYVTLEPCIMCLGAIIQSGIKTIYYGAHNKTDGALGGSLDFSSGSKIINGLEIHYIKHNKSSEILKTFFQNKR